MEEREKAQIQALLSDDAELSRLWREHQEFEEQISAIEAQPYLSWDEWSDIHRLKKLKLAGKDRIAKILSRAPVSQAR